MTTPDAADGRRIHVGDLIQTRRNTSEIHASDHRRSSTVMWTVIGIDPDGTVEVSTRCGRHPRPAACQLRRRRRRARLRHDDRRSPGRTVDRGHVVVTPRTSAASLYVGMSRSQSNHAHVVCDSHDHTEFELGDLTGEQAFAAATLCDPTASSPPTRSSSAGMTAEPTASPPAPVTGAADRSRTGGRSGSAACRLRSSRRSPPVTIRSSTFSTRSRTRPGGTRSSEPPPPRSTGVVPTPRDRFVGRLRRAATATPVDHDRATYEHSAHQQR